MWKTIYFNIFPDLNETCPFAQHTKKARSQLSDKISINRDRETQEKSLEVFQISMGTQFGSLANGSRSTTTHLNSDSGIKHFLKRSAHSLRIIVLISSKNCRYSHHSLVWIEKEHKSKILGLIDNMAIKANFCVMFHAEDTIRSIKVYAFNKIRILNRFYGRKANTYFGNKVTMTMIKIHDIFSHLIDSTPTIIHWVFVYEVAFRSHIIKYICSS